MINIRRYNPVLKERLHTALKTDAPAVLVRLLQSLTVADNRTASYILSEQLLPTLSAEQYWHLFLGVVPVHSKAYLGTFLKAAVIMARDNRLELDHAVLQSFNEVSTAIDARKFLEALLPYLKQADDVRFLVRLFLRDQLPVAAPYLIGSGTAATYFVLFKLLKSSDCSSELLRVYTIQLMKSGKPHAFNMASILTRYFDLKNIPGHFSLEIEPYELSCLDQNFASFSKMLKR